MGFDTIETNLVLTKTALGFGHDKAFKQNIIGINSISHEVCLKLTPQHFKLSGSLTIRFSKSVQGRKEGTQLYVNRLI